jgi:hypothetical protein
MFWQTELYFVVEAARTLQLLDPCACVLTTSLTIPFFSKRVGG